jgi:cytochrome P450
LVESEEATMTVDAIGTNSPTVFDAGLPPIAYEHARNPEEAHRLIRQARRQGPIALGPHGPEVLSHELVRTVLRDPRFCMPKGGPFEVQGITSGPVWDKATTGLLSRDGADHNRLRLLVSKAFTPRSTARLKTTIAGVIAELVDPVTTAGRCDVVADIARQYPIPIISGLLGAPRQDRQLFSDWADDIFKLLNWNVANDAPVIMAAFDELDAYIEDMIAQRRHNLTDDLISELMRAEDDGDRLTFDELVMLRKSCSWQAPTPLAISWPPQSRICATTPRSGPCWLSSPSSHRRQLRSSCAIARSFSAPSAKPSRMSNSTA